MTTKIAKSKRVEKKDILRLLKKINKSNNPDFRINIDWNETPYHVTVHRKDGSEFNKFRLYYQIANYLVNLPEFKEIQFK